MAEGVVEGLEMVQVDEQQRPLPPVAGAGRHRLVQPIQQQAPVRQLGQGIVESQMFDLVFRGLALGDVLVNEDRAFDAPIVAANGHGEIEDDLVGAIETLDLDLFVQRRLAFLNSPRPGPFMGFYTLPAFQPPRLVLSK
jgi:hypothetical protein